jgi:predicted GNAT family N-acyltransferase
MAEDPRGRQILKSPRNPPFPAGSIGGVISHKEVVLIAGQDQFALARDIRWKVFVEEQGIPAEEDIDELDATADQFLAVVDGTAVGTARLVMKGDTGILGRMAVLKEARGTGLGVALIEAVERQAAQLGVAWVELHAQSYARGFYERLGYVSFGDEYEEVGITHISMRKPVA